jgi:hypothetical protein
VFSEWIAESQKDLKDLRADALDSIRSEANIYNFGRLGLEDWKTLEAQWDDLIRKSDARFDTILGLIENKRVMIVSLRDGVSQLPPMRI